MSSEQGYLVLRLSGPLQSWGFDSEHNQRKTALFPTKSAIAGMCCAALGFSRGSAEESGFLEQFRNVRMTAVDLAGNRTGRLQDFHTVQATMTADGKTKDCHITHRAYLTDAEFAVILEGENPLMERIGAALADPVWGLWLGRKSCIPSAPVFCGLKNSREEALSMAIGEDDLASYAYQEDATSFAEGVDSLQDNAISFDSEKRLFSGRRIRTHHGKN